MPPVARFLQMNSGQFPVAESPEPLAVDSDVVVVMAALLCAIICVIGLTLAARCAWIRRSPTGAVAGGGVASSAPHPNKGLKKKVLKALPKVRYGAGDAEEGAGVERLSECAICLTEFAEGDEIRLLPQCGHGFHVGCVDTWLGSHSSCPSCRRLFVVAAKPALPAASPPPPRCHRCGASSSNGSAAAATREDGDPDRFLP